VKILQIADCYRPRSKGNIFAGVGQSVCHTMTIEILGLERSFWYAGTTCKNTPYMIHQGQGHASKNITHTGGFAFE